jgi:hypothetical protein
MNQFGEAIYNIKDEIRCLYLRLNKMYIINNATYEVVEKIQDEQERNVSIINRIEAIVRNNYNKISVISTILDKFFDNVL